MRLLIAVVLLSGNVLFSAALPQEQDQDKATLMQIYNNEMQDYQSWAIVPGSTEKMPGKGAHGKFITTYANAVALNAIQTNASAMPDGAILVKDNFNTPEDGKPWSAVMMKKIDGEWFFGVFFPLYEPKAAGLGTPGKQLSLCMDCHRKAVNDRVFLWRKKQ